MKRLFLGAIILAFVPFTAAIADRSGFDPVAAYGDRIEFEVLRNGDPIGVHTVDFLPMDDGLQVDVEMKLNVTFLGLTVYNFGYRSGSFWKDGRMVELNAFTDDDGDQTRVSATGQGDGLTINGPMGAATGPANLLPTDHWNPAVQGNDMVLNTITGQVADVTITPAGAERIETGTGSRMATRHVYSGDLHDVEVWYDSQGRWVRLRFPDKSDGVIDYRCIRCGDERTASK